MSVETGPASTTQTAPVSLWGRSTPPSWPWRRGALLLAVAAQLITISALVSVDRLGTSWWSLLLAIAPAPLAAAAAFAPAHFARLVAAWAGAVVILAGLIGGILHTGLFFAPALVVLVVGAVKLGRETA
jgi:hypothetical protein